MKRGVKFDCGHPGAEKMYCSTFSSLERVRLCPTCVSSINDNQQDPRSVAPTVGAAITLRDEVKHAAR